MSLQNKHIPNPLRGENTVLTMTHNCFLEFDNASLKFSYIPDRDIIQNDVFDTWFNNIQKENAGKDPEYVAGKVIGHFYNELLPYHAILDIVIHHKNGVIQRIQVIKTQPKYIVPEELKELLASN